MKTLVIILLALTITSIHFGQTSLNFSELKEELTAYYNVDADYGKVVRLETGFASARILNPKELQGINADQLLTVDLLFSNYPIDHDHTSLTSARFRQLVTLCPGLLDLPITFRLIRQTNCSNAAEAKELFHGFVIRYKPLQSKKLIDEELAYLKSILDSEETKDTTPSPNIEIKEEVYPSEHKTEALEKEYYDMMDTLELESHTLIKSRVTSHSLSINSKQFTDSTVTAILNRNQWKDMLIVADITGSMSPYTAQLMLWLRLNSYKNEAKQFVFFNDGDFKPNWKKRVGSTGGLYSDKLDAYEDIEALAYKAMSNGGGGDAPENDIEALIKAEKDCPDCVNTILIADNWAPLRDLKLAEHLSKPVKIILCGAQYGVNPEYLELASLTGGSVHTMHTDLVDLMHLNEGETIEIDGQIFKIEKGKFQRFQKG
ncbi:MAG: hypothetical protein AB8B53_05755 [Flavobacteriales bacterium]